MTPIQPKFEKNSSQIGNTTPVFGLRSWSIYNFNMAAAGRLHYLFHWRFLGR